MDNNNIESTTAAAATATATAELSAILNNNADSADIAINEIELNNQLSINESIVIQQSIKSNSTLSAVRSGATALAKVVFIDPILILRRLHNQFSTASYSELFIPKNAYAMQFMDKCFHYSIIISIISWIIIVLLFQLIQPNLLKSLNSTKNPLYSISIILLLFEYILLICAHIGMFSELRHMFIKPMKVFNMYLSVLISFALLYFILFTIDRESFNIAGYSPSSILDREEYSFDSSTVNSDINPNSNINEVNDIFSVGIFFLYFGATIQTSTGFGDCYPIKTHSRFVVDLQMLLGLIYHAGVFGLVLTHFEQFASASASTNVRANTNNNNNNTIKSKPIKIKSKLRFSDYFPCLLRIKSIPIYAQIHRYIVSHLFLVSLILQLIAIGLLHILPKPFTAFNLLSNSEKTLKVILLSIYIILLLIQFLVVISGSIRLINHLNSSELNFQFLASSYISTAILFASVYFLLFISTNSHEFSIIALEDSEHINSIMWTMIYFSFTAMSGTGFGDIYARGVISRIFVASEMVVSIIYGIVLIGLGSSILIRKQDREAAKQFNNQLDSVRRESISSCNSNSNKTPLSVRMKEFDNEIDLDLDLDLTIDNPNIGSVSIIEGEELELINENQ